MLSRSQRLSGEQLDSVMEKGRVIHSPFFWLKFIKYDGKSRFSAITPQKAFKTAVERNSIRRKVYEGIKLILPTFPTGYLVIICAKVPVKEANFTDLSKEIKTLFVKSGLLK